MKCLSVETERPSKNPSISLQAQVFDVAKNVFLPYAFLSASAVRILSGVMGNSRIRTPMAL